VLTSSTLTPPATATGSISFTSNNGDTKVEYHQYFASSSDLNAAFPDGNYQFSINTSTPNTYSSSLALSSLTYPSDIPTITGGTWSGGALIVNPNISNTIVWNASNATHLSFTVSNTGIHDTVLNSGSGLPTSYTIAANTLQPDQSYFVQLGFANGNIDTTQISGVQGAAYYENSTEFTIETTPEPDSGVVLVAGSLGVALLSRRRAKA